MSVLFKALQKAEKENEQRHAADGGSGFDPSRLAGSGAIKMAGSRGINWRTAGMAAAFVLAVAIMAAFFLVSPVETPPARQVAALPPAPVQPAPVQPAAVQPATPGTTEAIPVLQPPAGTAPAPTVAPATEPVAPAAPATASPAAPNPAAPAQPAPVQTAAAPVPVPAAEPEAAPEAAPVEAADEPEETPAPPAAAPKPARPAKVAAAPAAPPRRQGVPEIAADSPARMLNPPIAIQRTEFELSGVGNAVQVREVSQAARDNVGAGYDALVNGAYDMALGFYDRALRDEPSSVLALLGYGAASHKLGRLQDAQSAYEKALKIDPENREALSNLTVITAERSPAEALMKLTELEKTYPKFSPIKAQIGLAYAKMGSMPQALDYLSQASSLSPDAVMYKYNMALVLDHLGRSEQAAATYEAVLASISSGRNAPELSSTDIERRVRYLRAR